MSTKTTTQLQNGDEDSPPAPPSNYLSLTINKKQRWLSECTFGPNGWTGWDVFQTGETVTKAIWYSWSSQDLWKEYLQTKGPTGGLKTIALIDLIQAFNPLVLTFGNPVFVDHYHLFKGGQRGNQLSAFQSGSYPRVDDDELDPESGQTPEWPYAPFEQDFPTLTDAKKELPLFLLRAEVSGDTYLGTSLASNELIWAPLSGPCGSSKAL